ncbi:MAG: hypothetical protein Q8K78_15970 [Planctomycetaceae bacterium]|nr:hypothetical protein [Planctomycetaceae bacterium]
MTLDDVFDDVLEIVSRAGGRISGDIEPFLADQIAAIPGTKREVVSAIQAKISEWFRCATDPPNWIQEAEWPTYNGKPMVFVGQIIVAPTSRLFHDDAGAYVFIDPDSGVTTTVIQVA